MTEGGAQSTGHRVQRRRRLKGHARNVSKAGKRRRKPSSAYGTPEGEMNGLLQLVQNEAHLVANGQVRKTIQSEYEALTELRQRYFEDKALKKKEDASEQLHNAILPRARNLLDRLNETPLRDPLDNLCEAASSKQAEALFLNDDTSLGSISSTEEQEEEPTSALNADAKEFSPGILSGMIEKSDDTVEKTRKKKRPKREKKAGLWWSSLTDVDPITVEPLSELPYPPFTIEVNAGKSSTGETVKVTHYFDGKELANYIVRTGNFSNPNNRQPLNRVVCLRLDEYLTANHLPSSNVTDAFDLSKAIKIQQRINSEDGDLEALQRREEVLRRRATVMAGQLFDFGTMRGSNQGRRGQRMDDMQQDQGRNFGFGGSRRVEAVAYGNGNLRVIDGNEWATEEDAGFNDEEEFPAMPSASGQLRLNEFAAQRSRMMRASREVELRRNEAMNAGGFPNPVDSPGTPSWPAPAGATQGQTAFGSSNRQTTAAEVLQRPKLQLKPRSKESDKPKFETLKRRPGSIFGSARPREQVLEGKGVDWRNQESKLEQKTQAAGLNDGLDGFLCPYLPHIVDKARKMDIGWVTKIEREIASFVEEGTSQRTKLLPVMSSANRQFFHTLARNYYGVDTTSVDPEPKRQIMLHKVPNCCAAEMMIAQAILRFDRFVGPRAAAGPDAYTAPPPRMLHRGSSSGEAGNNSLLLLNVTHRDGGRVPMNEMEDVLEGLGKRKSLFALRVLDNFNFLVEFSERSVGRSMLHTLSTEYSHGIGNFKWDRVQWWPVLEDWAVFQLSRLQGSLSKSDSEQQPGSGVVIEASKKAPGPLSKASALVSKEKPPTPSNLWNHLQSEDSDEEEIN